MTGAADLPAVIPLFPLPGALLLPRARLPLNIFEPRYLVMLDDALKTPDRLIGMIQPVPGAGGGEPPELHATGCAGRVVAFAETGDGRYVITLAGMSRFRLARLEEGLTPYLRARVDWAEFAGDLEPSPGLPGVDRGAFLDRVQRYLAAKGLQGDRESLEKAADEVLINSLCMLCPFSVEEKQALLDAPDLATRLQMLDTLITFALAGGGDDGQMQ